MRHVLCLVLEQEHDEGKNRAGWDLGKSNVQQELEEDAHELLVKAAERTKLFTD